MIAELSISRQICSLPKLSNIFKDVIGSKRICVDLDGVICEYDFPQIVKNFFGVDLSKQAIFAYDLADVLGVAPALIDTMFKKQVFGKPNFIDGAIDTLKEWKAKGYELNIFSNRTKYMGFYGLEKWLGKWKIPYSYLTEGQIKYDVHIDDRPAKLMATNSKLKLLFDQPWNKGCHNITGELVRVKSWDEIKTKMEEK